MGKLVTRFGAFKPQAHLYMGTKFSKRRETFTFWSGCQRKFHGIPLQCSVNYCFEMIGLKATGLLFITPLYVKINCIKPFQTIQLLKAQRLLYVPARSAFKNPNFSWGKGSRCFWLTTYHPCSAETSRKSGALNYPEPLGPPRPVAGDFSFLFFLFFFKNLKLMFKNFCHCFLKYI